VSASSIGIRSILTDKLIFSLMLVDQESLMREAIWKFGTAGGMILPLESRSNFLQVRPFCRFVALKFLSQKSLALPRLEKQSHATRCPMQQRHPRADR
jgi:hypothetical protein